ncbi:hypothetical protein ACR77J_05390 [Tissierella praeacuta]|uniref:hypothetical protein n=1 Tax=Tissierella praeacuta TaxID=43131 RepID=UPI003DA21421
MKKRKRLWCVGICLILFFQVPLSTFASNPSLSNLAEQNIYYDEDTNQYVTNFILIENGVSREISFQEFKKITSNSQEVSFKPQDTLIEPMSTIYFSKFIESSRSEVTDKKKSLVVTQWYEARYAPEKITVAESKTIQNSFNVSLTGAQKDSIFAKVSGGYTRSASTSKSISGTQTVPKGYKGRVRFAPTLLVLKGDVENWKHQDGTLNPVLIDITRNVVASYPRKTDTDFADGLYYTEIEKLPPEY